MVPKALRERGHDPQAVAHFVNRLVFCMFADDCRPASGPLTVLDPACGSDLEHWVQLEAESSSKGLSAFGPRPDGSLPLSASTVVGPPDHRSRRSGHRPGPGNRLLGQNVGGVEIPLATTESGDL